MQEEIIQYIPLVRFWQNRSWPVSDIQSLETSINHLTQILTLRWCCRLFICRDEANGRRQFFVGRQLTDQTDKKEESFEVRSLKLEENRRGREVQPGISINWRKSRHVVTIRFSPSCLSRLCFLCFFEPISQTRSTAAPYSEIRCRRPLCELLQRPARVPRSVTYTDNTRGGSHWWCHVRRSASAVPLVPTPTRRHGGASCASFEYFE